MAERVTIDDVDRRILALLRENARRTVADIAEHVNLSPAPVKRRIDRLERTGVITGYSIEVDEAQIGPTIDAFTELRFSGDTDLEDIVAALSRVPEVSDVFTIAGDPDALLRIRVQDVPHLKEVVNVVRRVGSVTATKTLMVLDHWTRPTPP
ncbi:MAG: Lrp/AsnC family transcriptional regulator [Solirubrobacterales bacterium]|nr:Lrp/AsnC family transcriptional regulator [Solirubrobacterales bacterium]